MAELVGEKLIIRRVRNQLQHVLILSRKNLLDKMEASDKTSQANR